ncbi:MAG: hypothetical protein CR972_05185 [Candidatus Moraniibacteriota bacterium]|nr:MAG: hypothetical protein CR972_05185 [Candidatus Moranbacteria bacterium]
MTQKDNYNEKKEKSFDEYYKKAMHTIEDEHKRMDIVCDKLLQKYENYDQTRAFIEYLRSIESVFMNAENGKWSVEKTQDEMIKAEIYLISHETGIDEKVFMEIYEEFQKVNNDVKKTQEIAEQLIERYSNIKDCIECDDCKKFIVYVRDALLVFSQSIAGSEQFDEIKEVREELIRKRMQIFAQDNRPPLEILEDIYKEFLQEVHN